jgi:predicted DsbA family dithiol-disulfide isomerase
MMNVELFYSPTCPTCPQARAFLLDIADEMDGLHLEEVNVLSSEGVKRADHYGVRSVPTLIIDRHVRLTTFSSKDAVIRRIREVGNRLQQTTMNEGGE